MFFCQECKLRWAKRPWDKKYAMRIIYCRFYKCKILGQRPLWPMKSYKRGWGLLGGWVRKKWSIDFLGEIIRICCTCVSRRLGWGQEGRIYGPLLGSGGGRGRRFGMDGKGGGEGSIHCTAPKFFCYLNHFNHFSVCQLFVVHFLSKIYVALYVKGSLEHFRKFICFGSLTRPLGSIYSFVP